VQPPELLHLLSPTMRRSRSQSSASSFAVTHHCPSIFCMRFSAALYDRQLSYNRSSLVYFSILHHQPASHVRLWRSNPRPVSMTASPISFWAQFLDPVIILLCMKKTPWDASQILQTRMRNMDPLSAALDLTKSQPYIDRSIITDASSCGTKAGHG
jgi:hypothetical protein